MQHEMGKNAYIIKWYISPILFYRGCIYMYQKNITTNKFASGFEVLTIKNKQ